MENPMKENQGMSIGNWKDDEEAVKNSRKTGERSGSGCGRMREKRTGEENCEEVKHCRIL